MTPPDEPAGSDPPPDETRPRSARLPTSTLLTYALPSIPTAAIVLPIFAYLPQLYAQSPALGLTVVGTIFAISKVWDVVTDPILGTVSDRFRSRWGRRRHWMVAGTPIMVVAVFFLFTWPAIGGIEVGAGYLLGWLLVLYLGWTLLTLSHLAWGAELTTDYDERSRILGTREVFFFVGTLLALIPPALIERAGGSVTSQVASMGWMVIVLLPIAVGFAVWRVGERPHADVEPLPWRRAVSVLFQSRPLRMLLAVDLAISLSNIVNASMFRWLAGDVLGLERWAGTFLFVFVIFGSIFIPVIVRVSYRLGKNRTLAASCLMNSLVLPLLFFVPEGNAAVALVVILLISLHLPAGPVMARSMAADVVDHDHLESGRSRAGLVFSLMTMTNKIGSAIGVAFAFAVLDWIGFKPGEENDRAALEGLRAVYVVVPIAMNLVIAGVMLRFPLTRERQQEIRLSLEAGRSGGTTGEPFPE